MENTSGGPMSSALPPGEGGRDTALAGAVHTETLGSTWGRPRKAAVSAAWKGKVHRMDPQPQTRVQPAAVSAGHALHSQEIPIFLTRARAFTCQGLFGYVW